MKEHFGFRTGFRGFVRQDVLAYIDELRLSMRQEQEEHRAECELLRAELTESRGKISELAEAERQHAELTTRLAESEETINALREQVETLSAQLKVAEAAVDEQRELALSEALAESRAEAERLRARESELTAQLAETHQAVASLWQEKEAADRKVNLAITYADREQQVAEAFRRELGDAAPQSEERSASKPMDRWLF